LGGGDYDGDERHLAFPCDMPGGNIANHLSVGKDDTDMAAKCGQGWNHMCGLWGKG